MLCRYVHKCAQQYRHYVAWRSGGLQDTARHSKTHFRRNNYHTQLLAMSPRGRSWNEQVRSTIENPFTVFFWKKQDLPMFQTHSCKLLFRTKLRSFTAKCWGEKKRRLSWAWDPTALQVPPDALVASLSLLSECCPSSESPTYHTSTQNSEPGPGKGQQAHSPVAKMKSFAKSLSVCWKTCGCQWCWSMLNNLIYNHQIIFYNHQ